MPIRTLIQDDERRKLFDYEARTDGQPVYIGAAHPAAKDTDFAWQIRKLTYNAGDNVTDISFANGTSLYDKQFSQRTTYDYTPDS